MRKVEDVIRAGERLFETALPGALELDAGFIASVASEGADIPRVMLCQAMALFVLRTAKDGLLALDAQQALANGLPPIYRDQIPYIENVGDIVKALRVAAELFEHMDKSPADPKPGSTVN